MSAEAVGWVWRRSPYRGITLVVHLAIADSVNDQNEHELWMRQAVLATKCRTRRATVNEAIAKMVTDGYLELLVEGSGGANRYRFLMPSDAPVVYDSQPVRARPTRRRTEPADPLPLDGGARSPNTGCTPTAQGVRADRTGGVRQAYTEPKGTQVTQGEQPPATGSVAQPLVKRVWDRSDPKPATPFIGAVKIAERLLAAGWPADAVEDAMVEAPTISTGAVELVLNRRKPPARRGAAGPVSARRDAPEGRVTP